MEKWNKKKIYKKTKIKLIFNDLLKSKAIKDKVNKNIKAFNNNSKVLL